jgi:hypothetical protein
MSCHNRLDSVLRGCQFWLMALVLLTGPAATLLVEAATCSSAPAGLVGWWPGDGSTNDIAGSNSGILQGGATATAVGMVGQAFSFDGTNSFVEIADAQALKPTNLTIEAWVTFSGLDSALSGNAPAGEQYIVFKQNSAMYYFDGYALEKHRTASGDAFMFTVGSGAGPEESLLSATLISTSLWYHVAAVRGSNYMQLYVNGQLERQTNVSFPQDYGTLPLYFGTCHETYWDGRLKGRLDEVSLYNRALSSNEVAAIYTAGASGKCKTPNLTTQPQSQTVAVTSNAVFTVAATGTTPLNYQWRFNGTSRLGATNTSLTLTNSQTTNGGSYTVVVTNPVGSVTSAVAVLTVLVPPAITAQPQSVTNVAGTTASLSVTATGSAPLGYQWQLNGMTLANGGRISGATTNALAITGVQPADAGSYTLVVSNAVGVVTSAAATLTVSGPPVITAQPAGQSVAAGNSVSFSVTAAGTLPLVYQWRKNGASLTDGSNRSGATSSVLTLANVQTNDAGSYQVVVTNSVNSVTSTVAILTVSPAIPPIPQSAGAVVLVNSHSAKYADFQHFIQPYLDNFGFPYTVQDISTNAPGQSISNCAVIIIGHGQLDTNQTYLTSAAQANLSVAVSNGTGLVNFDNNLAAGSTPRYQFVQSIFGFTYGSGAAASSVSLPLTEPSSQMHYVTARHPTNDVVTFRSSINLPGITVPVGVTTLASAGGEPLVAVRKYGQGRAVQWGSYDWMVSTVLGPVDGLDDVLWRGVVWAARKPLVMRGMPNFVTMRMDDVSGPFWWVHLANQVGFKPFVALFINDVSEASAADLRGLVTNGNATASIHSFDCCNTFFYFNHAGEQALSDLVQSNNFYVGTQWHLSHGIPISKVCATHYSEIGPNAFAGLKNWGMEFVPIEIVPGAIEYAPPYAPWLVGGPYRLYETPQQGQVNWPTYYADWLTVPGHPELSGQFFNVYSEVRDADATYHEWEPNTDVAGSISRGTQILKRDLDSMVMATAFSHEWAFQATPCCPSVTTVTTNQWLAILQGITNNLAAYNPIFVTLDYASQYVRAMRTSRLLTGDYDPASGHVTATLSGKTDLATSVYVFTGADSAISSSFGTVPAFSGSVTNTVASLPAQPVPPTIINDPVSVTTNAGATVVFTVTAAGTTPLSYQWLFNGATLAEGSRFSGTTNATLGVSSVQPAQAGNYSVLVTNNAGAATSGVAILRVADHPLLLNAKTDSEGALTFTLNGAAGLVYMVEITTNLLDWGPLTRVTNSSGQADFTDTTSSNSVSRFYRARWMP